MNNSNTPSPADLNQLVTLYNSRRYTELEGKAGTMVKRFPASGFAWKLLGAAQQMQGKNALEAFSKTAKLLPGEPDAHFNLGIVQKNLGLFNEAAASYHRALKLNPKYAEAYDNLGNVLKELGQSNEAVASFRKALSIKPHLAMTHNNLGSTLKDMGKLDEAVACYRRAISFNPKYVEGYNNLGNALKDFGQLDKAIDCYRHAISINPQLAATHNNLGSALKDQRQLDASIECFRTALKLKPDYAEAYNNLGNVHKELRHFDKARESYLKALEINPKLHETMVGMGYLCVINGETSDAEKMVTQALSINPDSLEANILLANIKKSQAGNGNLEALLKIEKNIQDGTCSVPDKSNISLQFALGKCLSDQGEHNRAFPHFLEGCRLKRATFEYDATQMTQHFDEIIRTFDQTTLNRLKESSNHSRVPIFVLGMPRSGTTLTEQILASHPDVFGAGELPNMEKITQRSVSGVSGFPGNILALDQEALTEWPNDYLSEIRQLAPDTQHITDKLPGNFKFIGLIHAVLPNAKIIHVNRNPVDTCLSCFSQLFSHGMLLQTYDLRELGKYYADYVRLMDHWRTLLPAGSFLDVKYEDIVADQEFQARRIIDYCDLEWNDACIDFHKLKRSVNTASMNQVRQPIYKSSVERWRSYEKHLKPLLDILGDLVPKHDEHG